MANISLNAVDCVPQPNLVNEEPEQIMTDQVSINGAMQRDSMGKKKKAALTWNYLTATQYRTFITAFEAGTVHYKNTLSTVDNTGTLEFDGLATYEASDYVNGGAPLMGLKVTIREV